MVHKRKASFLLRLFVYTLLIALIIGGSLFFKPQISVAVYLIIAFLKMLVFECSRFFKDKLAGKIFSFLNVISSFLMGALLGVLVLITPFSVYSYFFSLASQDFFTPLNESYYVATLFFSIIIYFSLILSASAIEKNHFAPFMLLLSLISGLFLIIYGQPVFFIITTLALVIFALLTFKKQLINLISAIIICGLIASLSMVTQPEPQGREIVEKVFFPEVRHWINQCFPSLPLMLNIPGFSLSTNSTPLGGKNILSSIPVFDVENPEGDRLYLATEIFDSYNRNSWSQTQEPRKFDSGAFIINNDINSLSRPIQIKVLTEVFPAIPFTYDTIAFKLDNRLYHMDSVNWSGMSINPGLGKSQTLTLFRYREFQRDAEINIKPYLSVPTGLPERVKTLAQQWAFSGSSSEQVLKAIQNFLAMNFTYDLNAPLVADDEDFLDQFLFDKKWGYCTHFATAFTILARLNKIPVRYVSGFLIYFDPGEKKQRVTARAAHAWPEVWTEEKGWQVWEVTRAVNRNYYNGLAPGYLDYLQRFMIDGNEIARNDLTRQQLRDLLGIDFAPKESANFFEIDEIQPFLAILLAIGLLFTFFIVFRKKHLLTQIRLMFKQTPWQKFVNKIVYRFPAVPGPEKQGWLMWQENVMNTYWVNQREFKKMVSLILKAAYTKEPLCDEDLTFLKNQGRKKYQSQK